MATNNDYLPTPVFIKLSDGSSFKQKKSKEISEIIQDLENELGTFAKGGVTIAPGGDIFIRPTSILQQEHLLSIKTIAKGTIGVTCTLPKSHSFQRVVIRQVPMGDTNEEIYQALTAQVKTPSTTVALEFEGPAPQEIILNYTVFRPEKQHPTPLRCKKCQKLGHTERFCSDNLKCPNCSTSHNDINSCNNPPHCTNCKGDHPASSPSCPHFIRWKTLARTAGDNRTSHQEAKAQSYSDAVKMNLGLDKLHPEIEIMKSQIEAIQTEMAMLRTDIGRIKPLEEKVNSLDSAVNQIQGSLSSLDSGQQATNNKLDKISSNHEILT
ncbi:hypothetical protein OUZ56_010333 [Daphnia magna]|uniref:CCHC-type domain-containing protein n=1 Tax=Daphnia magna TaxID=35525 RepID=A0ABR0AIB6_9CRUS|nr:hypothetical protein OUZ56_010333 [Daphnia magna]